MNKNELASEISKKTGESKATALKMIEAFTETVVEEVSKGEKVLLVGFGTFDSKKQGARVCKNLHTNESITVPEKYVPRFKPGAGFKESVLR